MVNLVLVGHSQRLLEALIELVEQTIGSGPTCLAAGGTEDGRPGTSLARLQAALGAALSRTDDACLVLYDTGSAWLTIEFALDELPSSARARVAVSDAPLVEGTLAAAARAAERAALDEVREAAEAAIVADKRPAQPGGGRPDVRLPA
ncbi:MAG TPA: hypothetical protein VM253_01210 [Candidatus Limnocylindrales bacterium]|nr:hypothetical protein [Candidatus Limnocylindrales bacterium]